jgi:hypothetical protein
MLTSLCNYSVAILLKVAVFCLLMFRSSLFRLPFNTYVTFILIFGNSVLLGVKCRNMMS